MCDGKGAFIYRFTYYRLNREVAKKGFFSHGFTQIITDKKITALRAKAMSHAKAQATKN
jgi:hypothetical protein